MFLHGRQYRPTCNAVATPSASVMTVFHSHGYGFALSLPTFRFTDRASSLSCNNTQHGNCMQRRAQCNCGHKFANVCRTPMHCSTARRAHTRSLCDCLQQSVVLNELHYAIPFHSTGYFLSADASRRLDHVAMSYHTIASESAPHHSTRLRNQIL